MRIIGDEGPHVTLCVQCGILARGTYGYCETQAAIHRTLEAFKTVYTLTDGSFQAGIGQRV